MEKQMIIYSCDLCGCRMSRQSTSFLIPTIEGGKTFSLIIKRQQDLSDRVHETEADICLRRRDTIKSAITEIRTKNNVSNETETSKL